ncbi:sulfotransferase family protein [Nocardia jiangxiensis]|uniref:Sulfotransferase family protein n=1 Tax=Nocardia jiangxiensis TaxID=282685 RepID=A0ABW6RT29_9NOCA|nr:sulfotransferase [Nocardia jiangxiensis]
MSSPLLIFGAGQRCGSTLVQRLISSHPEAFIWGEQHGRFGELLDAFESLIGHSAEYGEAGRIEFAVHGYQGFLANLMPEPAEMQGAFTQFCTRLFQAPDARVWGFKEVRFDRAFAERLQRYLPGVRVIFIVRDPRDVLSSLDEWEARGWWTRADTELSFENWKRIAASFLEAGSVPVLSVRYEDFIADREAAARNVGEFAGLDVAGFDMSVFDRKVHNLGLWDERELRPWQDMAIDLRYLLFDEGLRATAEAYDYHL